MKKPYFVMLYVQSGESATPLVNADEEPVFFANYEDANSAGRANFMGANFGYAVFSMEEPYS